MKKPGRQWRPTKFRRRRHHPLELSTLNSQLSQAHAASIHPSAPCALHFAPRPYDAPSRSFSFDNLTTVYQRSLHSFSSFLFPFYVRLTDTSSRDDRRRRCTFHHMPDTTGFLTIWDRASCIQCKNPIQLPAHLKSCRPRRSGMRVKEHSEN